jgi:predicted phosphoadenosine phosphosulfate sulfurtransferase
MFPDDKHLFPARWLSRVTENIDETSDEKKYRTTDRFVEARVKAKDSSNRSVRYTFILLIAVSAIVALAMYAKVWQNWGKSNIQEESSSPKATANMSLQQTP